MQPIELIETINHLSNLDSKNTRRQIKQLTRGFICRSLELPIMIPTSLLRKLELLTSPTLNQVSFNRFLTSLALVSFLSEVKRTFINFLKTHHTLGSSRATLSCLRGFTSKSNKCHKDYFTKIKCSSAHKENSLNPPLVISHKSQDPHKERLERANKVLG
jgi:hypothetical protein